MKCQRCLQGEEAKYRVYSDVLDLKVCSTCAAEACRLGSPLNCFVPMKPEQTVANGGPKHRAA